MPILIYYYRNAIFPRLCRVRSLFVVGGGEDVGCVYLYWYYIGRSARKLDEFVLCEQYNKNKKKFQCTSRETVLIILLCGRCLFKRYTHACVSVAWRTLGQNAKWALTGRSFEKKITIICGYVYLMYTCTTAVQTISDRFLCILCLRYFI